jgi:catechol 2,3-dioxygenase-like lactoylglutathione lyase family enzyme
MASIKRIDHVAIAVRDVDQATEQYVKLLNAVHIRTETLREKAGVVKVAYMQIGRTLSLVQSLEDGFINQHTPNTAKAFITWSQRRLNELSRR